jgi:hypothetical protein
LAYAENVIVAWNDQTCVFTFVPSVGDSTFRPAKVPPLELLHVPHSTHSKFASEVPKVANAVTTPADSLSVVTSLRSLLVAA